MVAPESATGVVIAEEEGSAGSKVPVVEGTQIRSSAAEEVVPTAAAEPLGGGAAGEGEPPEEEKEN